MHKAPDAVEGTGGSRNRHNYTDLICCDGGASVVNAAALPRAGARLLTSLSGLVHLLLPYAPRHRLRRDQKAVDASFPSTSSLGPRQRAASIKSRAGQKALRTLGVGYRGFS
jgi:hypothetical protein